MPRTPATPADATPATRQPSTQKFAVRMGERPGIADRLLDLIATIPASAEPRASDPAARANSLARRAAAKSAATAGVLALPPGALGWVTITPELYAVWKIQAQMVSDIAAAYGRHAELGREQMLYCLFGHTAAGAFKDLVVQVGERYLVRRTPLAGLYAVGNKIALLIAQRSAGRAVTRWMPVLGALGVAGFVYVDTDKVAETAIAMFAREMQIEDAVVIETPPEATAKAPRAAQGIAAERPAATPAKRPRRKKTPAADD